MVCQKVSGNIALLFIENGGVMSPLKYFLQVYNFALFTWLVQQEQELLEWQEVAHLRLKFGKVLLWFPEFVFEPLVLASLRLKAI